MKNNRPRIKLQKTAFDYFIEILSVIVLVGIWFYVLYSYSDLPNEIPVHYNAAGIADKYDGKQAIFMLPIVGILIFIGLTVLNKFPHAFNYPTEITEENAERLYKNGTALVRALNLVIMVVFGFIVYKSINARSGSTEGLGDWFSPALVIIINLPAVYYLIKMFKKK